MLATLLAARAACEKPAFPPATYDMQPQNWWSVRRNLTVLSDDPASDYRSVNSTLVKSGCELHSPNWVGEGASVPGCGTMWRCPKHKMDATIDSLRVLVSISDDSEYLRDRRSESEAQEELAAARELLDRLRANIASLAKSRKRLPASCALIAATMEHYREYIANRERVRDSAHVAVQYNVRHYVPRTDSPHESPCPRASLPKIAQGMGAKLSGELKACGMALPRGHWNSLLLGGAPCQSDAKWRGYLLDANGNDTRTAAHEFIMRSGGAITGDCHDIRSLTPLSTCTEPHQVNYSLPSKNLSGLEATLSAGNTPTRFDLPARAPSETTRLRAERSTLLKLVGVDETVAIADKIASRAHAKSSDVTLIKIALCLPSPAPAPRVELPSIMNIQPPR